MHCTPLTVTQPLKSGPSKPGWTKAEVLSWGRRWWRVPDSLLVGRGQNTMSYSQVSKERDVTCQKRVSCPFPARMVLHLHHLLVCCGITLL